MSPIRDLTERPTIPRLGKIRLGDRGGTNGAPRNLPYFVVPDEVAEIHGMEPAELPVVFLSDDLERIASQYYRSYNATNGLVCRGDGYQADALLDADELAKRGGDLTQPLALDLWAHGNTAGRGGATKRVIRQSIECPGAGYNGKEPCPAFAAKKCAVRAYFQFAIRDVPGLGVYQMDTGSSWGIKKLNGAIEMSRSILGGVAGVPMIMRRVQLEVAPDGIKKKVWGIELEVDTQYSLANLIALRAGPVAAVLLPPVDESEAGEAEEDDESEGDREPATAGLDPQPTLGSGLRRGRLQDEHGDTQPVGSTVGLATVQGGLTPPAAPPPSSDSGLWHGPLQHGDTQPVTSATVLEKQPLTGDQTPPAAPPPSSDAFAPVTLLRAIEERHGLPAKQAAITVMARLWGTTMPAKLTEDQRADYTVILRFRLDHMMIDHQHEAAYTPTGFLVCKQCGDELEEGKAALPAH